MSNASPDEVLKRPLSQVENGSIKKNRSNSDIDRSRTGMSKDNSSALGDNHVEDGDGSEAETVVMPGKDLDLRVSMKKTIRHESNNTSVTNTADGVKNDASTNGSKSRSTRQEGSAANERKSDKNNTAETSRHSPSIPSPSHAQDQRRSRSRAASESNRTREDPHDITKSAVTRKRKSSIDGSEDKSVKRRIKREDFDNTTESRKTNNHVKSESPTRQRAPTNSSTPSSVQKPRRKPPPPLVVSASAGGKRTGSVDGESNESQSPRRSAQPKNMHTADSEKMLVRRRDKNGRTRVARACAVNDIDAVREFLKDHPEELDEPDNAGNTPLQIASLEGFTNIVRLLLKKGCKFDTENCDRDSPLIDSVENSHLEVVKLLLEAGVNPRKLNAKGEEPADLVDMEDQNGPAIKEELARHKAHYDPKPRPSAEKGPDTGRESISNRSPRDSPSTTTRSPPPQTTRRRAGRSEATRNDLLWVTATLENLVNYAGKGDDQAIMHLLNMRPISDVEAVFAAAKGGHDSCLNLLLALGRTDPDPAPLEEQKPGFDTPMLVAIGKGNLRVIELLLEQPGFDPTRRMYKGITYHEIAEKRQGDGWREEYRKLKAAYDEKMTRDGKRGSTKSSRTSSPKDSKKVQRERSPSIVVRDTSPSTTRNGLTRKKSSNEERSEIKSDHIQDKVRDGHPEKKSDRKHLKVPRHESREGSTATPDRETSPIREREKKSASDHELVPRPRKRLVSGKDLKDAQIKQRRNSLVSIVSTSSVQDSSKSKTSQEEVTKVKHRDAHDKKDKKRPRKSNSPQPSDSAKSPVSNIKRQKSNSESNVSKSSGNATKAPSMTRNIQTSGAAPVAMMGSLNRDKSKAKTGRRETNGIKEKVGKTDLGEKSRTKVREKASKHDSEKIELIQPKSKESKSHVKEDLPLADRNQEGSPVINEDYKNGAIKQESLDSPTIKLSPESNEHNTKRPSLSPTTDMDMEIDNHTEITALENSLSMEPEMMEYQPELTAGVSASDETSIEKTPQDENLKDFDESDKGNDTEQETSRQQAAEEESRKRDELARQEERLRYLNTLPRLFRDMLEHPDRAKSAAEIGWWLPLVSATGFDINPSCPQTEREELWITNFQVAGILVDCGLELTCFPTWSRIPLVEPLKNIVWRNMRTSICRWTMWDASDIQTACYPIEAYDAALVCMEKFFALDSFWVRLSDFETVVPQYPHLQGFNLAVVRLSPLQDEQDWVRKVEEAEKNAPINSPWRALCTASASTESPVQSTEPPQV